MSKFSTYEEYLTSDWWQDQRHKHIVKNRNAKCWCCSRRNRLSLHHENYQSLYAEIINQDIFILCWTCHRWLHHYLYFTWKVSLNRQTLRSRRFFVKSIYCILKFNIILFVWYIVASAICLSGHATSKQAKVIRTDG